MAGEEIPVERRENPHQAITAAGEEDRGKVRIGRQLVEGGEPLLVAAGQEAAAGEHVVREHRLETEPAQGLDAGRELLGVDRPGQGGHAHTVAGAGGRCQFGDQSGNQKAGELRKPSSVSPAEAG
jgi:hypothetical protein